jgi:hypothetical protein
MSKHSIDMPNCIFAAFCLVIDGFMTFNKLFSKKAEPQNEIRLFLSYYFNR